MTVAVDQELLTTKEVADYLRVHPITIRAWVRQNRIPVIRLGRYDFRFRRADVESFLASLKTSGAHAV